MTALVCVSDATAYLAGLCPGSVDLIVTDPPYGISYVSGRQSFDGRTPGQTIRKRHRGYFGGIEGDDSLPVSWLPAAYRCIKDTGAIYIFGHWRTWPELSKALVSVGFILKSMIVINKSNHGMGDLRGSYGPKHELLAFACKGRHLLRGRRLPDVWDMPVKFSGALRRHPNEKPLSWVRPCILSSSDIDDLVIDPFVGSGAILVAALRESRQVAGCDIEQACADMANDWLSLELYSKGNEAAR